MTQKSRNWFFDVPSDSAHSRFRKENRPSEGTYRNLLGSVPFFTEVSDTAAEGQQGLVKLATNANVIARTSAASGVMQTVVKPHQLPLMVGGGGTEAGTLATAVLEGGMKLTPIYDSGSIRMNFKIEFDPNNLDTVTVDTTADKAVILDATDSLPKLVTIASVFGTPYWSLAAGKLSPVTDGNDIEMGAGTVEAAGFLLEESTDRVIKITDGSGVGKKLTLKGMESSDNIGGILALSGGDSGTSSTGGNANLYGGDSSGGNDGDTIIGYTEGGVIRGKVAIGGAVDGTFLFKVHSTTFIDADVRLTISKTAAPTYYLGLDGSTDVNKRTLAEVNTDLFGSASKGDVLYYNSGWQRLADPGADSYLKFNNTSNIPEWDTSGIGTDVKVAVDAAATAGYLYAGGAGVLRKTTNGGLAITDAGDYITVGMDIDDLTLIGSERYAKGSYIAITNPYDSNATRKLLITALSGGKDGNWMGLVAGTDFTATPTSTSRIATSDLTDYITKGMALMFKLNSISPYRYAVVKDITATYIDIMGEPLVVLADELEELYVGGYDRIHIEYYSVLAANFNTATITNALETLMNRKSGDVWLRPSAKLVAFGCNNNTDDGTVDPLINMRIGATTSDYISTSNTNAGINCDTNFNMTDIDIDPTKNIIEYEDKIEIKVDKNSGTGDADNLQVMAIFVYTAADAPAP